MEVGPNWTEYSGSGGAVGDGSALPVVVDDCWRFLAGAGRRWVSRSGVRDESIRLTLFRVMVAVCETWQVGGQPVLLRV